MIVRLQRALPFLVVMAVAVFLWTVADGFEYRPRAGRPGPDLWPKIVIALLFLAAAWGALDSYLRPVAPEDINGLIRLASRAVGREEDAERDLQEDAGPPARGTWHALGGVLALLGYVAVISWVGYTIATFALMFTVMMLSGIRSAARALLWSGVGTLAFFIVFQKVAYVSLPLGEGPFRAFSLALMALLGVR